MHHFADVDGVRAHYNVTRAVYNRKLRQLAGLNREACAPVPVGIEIGVDPGQPVRPGVSPSNYVSVICTCVQGFNRLGLAMAYPYDGVFHV